ncbi:MAG: TatD family hydrolase [Rikenellaceae bacterium]
MNHFIVDIHTHSASPDVVSPRERGVHPWCAEEIDIEGVDWERLTHDAEAIGEIGLDYARVFDRQKQQQLFETQLYVAEQKRLPVVIHCVKAFESTLATLRKYNLRAVIFHGFIGSAQQARQLLDRGFYLSFGERTARSPKSIVALKMIPLDRLFVESDESSTPIYNIYEEIAALRGCTAEQLIASARDNYNKIFKIR